MVGSRLGGSRSIHSEDQEVLRVRNDALEDQEVLRVRDDVLPSELLERLRWAFREEACYWTEIDSPR